MRKSFLLVTLAILASSFAFSPASADKCGNENQMWISSGQYEAVPGNPVDSFPNGIAGNGSGRLHLGGYGCDLHYGSTIREASTVGIPGGGGVPVPAIETGPLDDEVNTNFITPGATHFTWWVNMYRNCPDCPAPREASWYYDTNSSGTWVLGGTMTGKCARSGPSYIQKSTCWATDVNAEDQFRSGLPIRIPSNAFRIRVVAEITDNRFDAFDDWMVVSREYAMCQSQDPADVNEKIAPAPDDVEAQYDSARRVCMPEAP